MAASSLSVETRRPTQRAAASRSIAPQPLKALKKPHGHRKRSSFQPDAPTRHPSPTGCDRFGFIRSAKSQCTPSLRVLETVELLPTQDTSHGIGSRRSKGGWIETALSLLKFVAMELSIVCVAMKRSYQVSLFVLTLCAISQMLCAQTSSPQISSAPAVPDWAQPGSADHVQMPPPADFHRPSRDVNTPIGMFQGQSDIGAALVPGSASYHAGTKQYTITSAGYNIWYSRDEFRYLWSKMSGDTSVAADVVFPDPKGYGDRKAVLVIRQSLEDDSKEAMVGEHGVGMIHLAWRSDKGTSMKDAEFRFGGTLSGVKAKRIGIEKRGDSIAIFVSLEGEPMHQLGPPIELHFDGPFYVGIGFCSHLPATPDTALLSNVILENSAGKVR